VMTKAAERSYANIKSKVSAKEHARKSVENENKFSQFLDRCNTFQRILLILVCLLLSPLIIALFLLSLPFLLFITLKRATGEKRNKSRGQKKKGQVHHPKRRR